MATECGSLSPIIDISIVGGAGQEQSLEPPPVTYKYVTNSATATLATERS